jgi:hypothetical protein
LLVDELSEDEGFKPSVLKELLQLARPAVRLTPILRKYVECLGAAHRQVRSRIEAQATADWRTVSEALERARAQFGPDLIALAVSSGEDVETPDEHHCISGSSWTRRAMLLKKNSMLEGVARRYVSAEHPGDAA